MTFVAEGRLSDSPYVDSIWRGRADTDHTLMCPADGRWNLCFTNLNGRMQISAEGAMSKAVPKTHIEDVDWLVIKFKLGVFLPGVPARKYLDGAALLPEAARQSFWLHSSTWEMPDYENADTFVDWLVRDDAVQLNPVVSAALQDRPQIVAERTLRHHFLRTIGLTQSHIRQIERARDAMTLLQHDVSILDVVDRLGYADQPHLTRSLKRFMGYTPTQVMGWRLPV
ncbi:MAG: helix-turn-helix domain-containing protein [Anaerolineae bacterium]|nr:helix-turn-helix domain-containing protein [Anaerolineae bacterium]